MVTMDLGVKLVNARIDTIELKHHIVRRLGQQQAEKYFKLLTRYLTLRLSKSAFDKLCIGLLGRDNISLHNGLIRAIMKNASINKSCDHKHGIGQSSLRAKVSNVFSQSLRKGKNPTVWECTFRDRLSALGPQRELHDTVGEHSVVKLPEQQSATEILLSLGSKPLLEVTSVEEGEEVEQDPGIHSRSTLRAPLGVCLQAKAARKRLCLGSLPSMDTCYYNSELPSSCSLRKRLELKLRLNVSTDCVDLLNNGLDVFMKRLLKSCLDLTMSRCECKLSNKTHQSVSVINVMRLMMHPQVPSVSIPDFCVAVQSNPRILGEDWAVLLEKVCLRASEDYMQG